MPSHEFAIIIPTLDEASTITGALARLPPGCDVVVADGGSQDGTIERVRRQGVRVVRAPRGRGVQMNAGARATCARTLLFLHADCALPPRALQAVHDVLSAGHDAGVFAIRYPSRHLLLRIVAGLSRFPSPLTSFGEGALFVRRELFWAVGGFPHWPLLEDVEMLARLRRAGRLGLARGRVLASPRRYEKCGVVRQQIRNFWVFGLYQLGVSPERLDRYYGTVRDVHEGSVTS